VFKKTLILPVLAAAALAAGCGGSGSSSSDSGSSSAYGSKPAAAATDTPAATKTAAAASATGSGTTVDIANFAFAPADIQAKVGDKITFVNKDSAAHTATATEGAKFDSGSLDQGASFAYVAKKAGTIKFVCSFHPNMTGTITVS
jgi:plastocyanin